MSKHENSGSRSHAGHAITNIQEAFEETLDQQRKLWEQVSQFARDEALRFTKQQFDQTSKALEHLQGKRSPQDFVAGQQQLLRTLVKDYADQSLRYTEMLHSLAKNAFTSTISAGQDAMRAAQKMGEEASAQAQETTNTMRQNVERLTDQDGAGGSRTKDE